jgi:hypothetical protein
MSAVNDVSLVGRSDNAYNDHSFTSHFISTKESNAF